MSMVNDKYEKQNEWLTAVLHYLNIMYMDYHIGILRAINSCNLRTNIFSCHKHIEN